VRDLRIRKEISLIKCCTVTGFVVTGSPRVLIRMLRLHWHWRMFLRAGEHPKTRLVKPSGLPLPVPLATKPLGRHAFL
jgi:hypothetical protein